jgi:hypothetical protein
MTARRNSSERTRFAPRRVPRCIRAASRMDSREPFCPSGADACSSCARCGLPRPPSARIAWGGRIAPKTDRRTGPPLRTYYFRSRYTTAESRALCPSPGRAPKSAAISSDTEACHLRSARRSGENVGTQGQGPTNSKTPKPSAIRWLRGRRSARRGIGSPAVSVARRMNRMANARLVARHQL